MCCPGGLLPFGLTIQDMRDGVSRLRNRVIARVFGELGYIEQWGSGIRRMTAACQEAGLDEPQLQEVSTRFRVILRRSSAPGSQASDETERAIVAALSQGKGLTTAEIATRIGRRTPRSPHARRRAEWWDGPPRPGVFMSIKTKEIPARSDPAPGSE